MLDLDVEFTRDTFTLRAAQLIDAPITGVEGASGSGKSTLLGVIAGLLKPRHGHIKLNNKILFDSEQKIWVPPHQRHLGLVFQDGQLLPHMNVRQNLLYGHNNIRPLNDVLV